MTCICEYESPIGTLTLAGDGESLTGLWMQGQKYFGRTLTGKPEKANLPVFGRATDWLDRYFAGDAPTIDFPLAPQGREFSELVWKALVEIPYGETTTYGAIAKKLAGRLGRKMVAARAVGGAVGHNPISIIIPCHRVLGANGSLTGFAGGVDKKEWLLRHEKIPG